MMKKLKYYWEQLRTHRLLYNIVLIVLSLLVLALVANWLMQFGTRHGARRTVPDFAGISLDEAQRLAKKNDLKININDSLYVPAYAGGTVLDQLPAGGVEVKPGRTIYITINAFTQKMVPVPYVAQRSLRQAKNMLEIAGLGIEQLVYQPDMATNYVLSEEYDKQPVTADSRIEAPMGSGITLYVGVEGGAGTTVVPQVVGLRLSDAKSRLWEAGLNIGDVQWDKGISLLNEKDAQVYAQTPAAERSASLGGKVVLRLTLDAKTLDTNRKTAAQQAKTAAAERQQQEAAQADSLTQAGFDAAITDTTALDGNDDGFFE